MRPHLYFIMSAVLCVGLRVCVYMRAYSGKVSGVLCGVLSSCVLFFSVEFICASLTSCAFDTTRACVCV